MPDLPPVGLNRADLPACVAARPVRVRGPWSKGWRAWLLRLVLYPSVLYLALIMGLLCMESQFLYHPHKYPAGDWDPKSHELKAEEVHFTASDGVRLHGWWAVGMDAEGQPDPSAPVLVWCHGNAGNLAYRGDPQAEFQRQGLTTLNWDYRGFGRSEGEPDEEGLYRDVDAACEFAVREKKTPPARLLLYGQSLGCAVAVDAAVRRPCAGLVLEAPFTSAPDMGQSLFPWVPVRWLMRQRYDSALKIPRLRVPLLVIHGARDEIIPIELGRALYGGAPQPKQMVEVEGAGHNDVSSVDAGYFPRIRAFADRVTGRVRADPD